MNTTSTRRHRGASSIEILVATGVAMLIPAAVAGMVMLARTTWARSDATVSTKQALGIAVARMEPDIRPAMRVDMSRSDSDRLTVILPQTDASGQYIVPLQEGDAITFRLSNLEGTVGAFGTYLWKYRNGVRDDNWKPVNLATPVLRFEYIGIPTVKSVRITLKAERTVSAYETASQTASTEVYLRNQAYAGAAP